VDAAASKAKLSAANVIVQQSSSPVGDIASNKTTVFPVAPMEVLQQVFNGWKAAEHAN